MTAYLGLGANLGEPESQLRAAVRSLAAHPGVASVRVSSLYRTRPVGGPPQPDFLNAAAAVETDLSARELLVLGLALERAAGRARMATCEPRTLDVDLLLYGEDVIAAPDLVVPHPRMDARAFVLQPLAEIAPGARHPLLQLTVAEMAARVPASGVQRLPGGTAWSEGRG